MEFESGREDSGYEATYHRIRALIQPFMPFMGEPEGAAEVITKALTVKVPHARYLVGREMRRRFLLPNRFLPRRCATGSTRFVVGL